MRESGHLVFGLIFLIIYDPLHVLVSLISKNDNVRLLKCLIKNTQFKIRIPHLFNSYEKLVISNFLPLHTGKPDFLEHKRFLEGHDSNN